MGKGELLRKIRVCVQNNHGAMQVVRLFGQNVERTIKRIAIAATADLSERQSGHVGPTGDIQQLDSVPIAQTADQTAKFLNAFTRRSIAKAPTKGSDPALQ